MGYQALLFCPDEKTARTVTQVLSELDFEVVPSSEPFAAVKKLMGERFDAVVVDCDNEQNATLLFKSARNAPNNHSSLAVAVVEGQAGVAKAFRIGANLVLTKPVNVEQAKGTLRVARGLLRKSEAAKPATGAVSPAASAPAPLRPVPQRQTSSVPAAGPAVPFAPAARAAVASVASQKAAPQTPVVASVPDEINEIGGEAFEAKGKSKEMGWPKMDSPEVKAAASHADMLAPKVGHSPSTGGFGTGAASAPAPAREVKPSVAIEPAPASVVSEPENPIQEVAVGENSSSDKEISAAATSFTLGGHVASGQSSGGSKKALLAVAGIALVGAVGYAIWMQWERSGGAATGSVPFAVQPVKTTAKVPQVAPSVPSAAPVASSAGTSSATSPIPDAPAAVAANKVTAPAAPAPTATGTKAVAVAAPIVIKSGGSRPGTKSTAAADASAPSLAGIASTGNSAVLPNLMGSEGKAPAPVLQQLH